MNTDVCTDQALPGKVSEKQQKKKDLSLVFLLQLEYF